MEGSRSGSGDSPVVAVTLAVVTAAATRIAAAASFTTRNISGFNRIGSVGGGGGGDREKEDD